MNKAILAAMIGAGATIAAAVIGVYTGRAYEQNSVQNQIEEVLGNNVNVIGDGNDIVINDATTLAHEYMKMQSDYDQLQSQNNYLVGENSNLYSELDKKKKKIEENETESNKVIEDLMTQINNFPIIDFKNLSLCIDVDDVSINTNKSVVTIDGRDYFSREIVEKIITDKQNLTIKNDTIFIGQVVAEKAKLTDQWLMGNLRCSIKDSSVDSHGNTHTDCIVLGNSNYYNSSEIKYSVGGKYDSINGTISVASESGMYNKGTITIKADNEVIYSEQLDKDFQPYPIDKPINNCKIIDISYNGNADFFIIFSDVTLYNK